MKILCIIQCSNLGGMEKVTLESLSLLKEAGHEVQMFSLHPVGDLQPLAAERDIPLSGTQQYKWAGFGNLPEVTRQIRSVNPDRVWLVGHNVGALFAAKLARKPAFLSIHFHHSERPLRFWKIFYGIAKRCAKRIHFVSRYIFEEVAELFGEKNQTVCIPNVFVEPPALMSCAEARRAQGLPEAGFLVGNAGWLIQRKAFDVFLRTAKEVKMAIPEAEFVIAGDGEERGALEQLAGELGLQECVHFMGWQKDLLPFYSSIDVLLFNSHFDCYPTTPLEAMVRGIPVVCSLPAGGLKEVLRHDTDGFLLDEHDPKQLAAAVVRLYEDQEYRARSIDSARERVLDVGSPEHHVKSLSAFLEL